ncbi:hypothetical protein FSST1_010550 [Fusarium sambucinum]
MQHLEGLYDGSAAPIRVGYLAALNECCLITPSECSLKSFVDFPYRHGYRIEGDHKLHDSGTHASCMKHTRPAFLQAWLFFKLIYCVIQTEKGPILTHAQLAPDGQLPSRGKLDTRGLSKALGDWHDYIENLYRSNQSNNQTAAIRKIFEANQILELAKQVVLANVAEISPSITRPEPVQPNRNQALGSDDEQGLCIMVLGETISAVLMGLIKACNLRMPGWEWDDGGGWGSPSYVSKEMSNRGWCPRSQAVVKGQLGRNATLLYFTLLAHRDNLQNCHRREMNGSQPPCTALRCHFIEAKLEQDTYTPLHFPTCNKDDCSMVGPDENAVLDILEANTDPREGTFPLMSIHTNESTQPEVRVEKWQKSTPFVTISHVWSQGLGNETHGKVRACQLRTIQDLISKALKDDKPHLFWLDTFAIPHRRKGDQRRTRLKRTAIGLIHHVFKSANHCIVIDRHLATQGRVFDSCHAVGAMLLASGWMTRLWTLQEAFVSRQLHLAVREHGEGTQEIFDLNTIWTENARPEAHFMSMTRMMKRKLDQNLMKVESEVPLLNKSITERALLFASAWRAVRYRTTGNAAEETLALSSLLGIHIPQNDIAGILSLSQQDNVECLMRKFWTAVSKDDIFKKSIPPGIIFLPGERLSCRGYRWAPSTWMSGQVEAYPFPLKTPKYPTELTEQGLIVRYPGFLLHPTKEKLSDIISSQNTRTAFDLCVGRGLDEWYRIVAARKTGQPDDASVPVVDDASASAVDDQQAIVQDLIKRLDSDLSLKIGIILSRPRPVEARGEIGLLVEICEEKSHNFGEGHPTKQGSMFCCRIIKRIEVRRLSGYDMEDFMSQTGYKQAPRWDPILSRYEKFRKENVSGVQLDETQSWCVDGFDYTPVPPPKQNEAPSRPVQQTVMSRFVGMIRRQL